jgi:hypothetical protein
MTSFAPYYRFFAKEPEFMRYVLRELTFYSHGRQSARFQAGREQIITGLEGFVRDARQKRLLRPTAKDRVVAQLIFGVYQAEIRLWLSEKHPKPAAGLARLRAMLRIVIDGLRPTTGAA